MIFINLIQTNLQTKQFGKEIEYYQRLESTNVEAWELIKNGEASHGMIVITDHQFHGKGRSGDSWFMSPSKGIAMSLILLEPLSPNIAGLIPLIAGIAMAKTLNNRGLSPKLKWPNDILLDKIKVGGILCESKISAQSVNGMVVGMGLNVNETKLDFPDEIISNTTSLFIESGCSHQRELIVGIFTTYFERCYEVLQNSPEEIISEWTSFCGHINQKVSFRFRGILQSGLFKGIDNFGQARVMIDGNERMFPSIVLD